MSDSGNGERTRESSSTVGQTSGPRVLRPPQAHAYVGISRAQMYRLEAAGQFPKRIKLGVNSAAYIVVELDQWLDDRIAGKPMKLAGSSIAMTAKSRALLKERRRGPRRAPGGACAE